MFNNYHELFDGYLDFYRKTLAADQPDIEHTNQLDLSNAIRLSSTKLGSFLNDILQQTLNSSSSSSWSSASSSSSSLEANLMNINNYLAGHQTKPEQQQQQQQQGDQKATSIIGSKQFDENGRLITIGSFNTLDLQDLLYILLIFFNFILAKNFLSNKLRQSNYLNKCGLRQKDRERLDECVWRLLFYSFSSTWLIYTCFLKHQTQLLFKPNEIFNEYPINLDLDEYLICLIECAFYLHATYALLFEDVWRRDTPMMLIHHLAAIFSLLSIFATRTHRVGLASVVLRDTCDVLLEVTKFVMSFRIQRGKVIKATELPIKCCFTVFAVSFVVNQLYYYPLFCLYHGLNITKVYQIQTPAMTGVLTCGLIFLLLDFLWFILILRLLYRMLFTSGSVDDLREYDADETLEIQRAKAAALLEGNTKHPMTLTKKAQ